LLVLPNAVAGEISHSFIGFGKANRTVIFGEDGQIKWKIDFPASDGWVQPNGNALNWPMRVRFKPLTHSSVMTFGIPMLFQ